MGSTAATHIITYTTPSTVCPETISDTIIIKAEQIANFSYADTAFCQREANPIANLTGATPNGVFSCVDPGLIFQNTVTGEINLLASAIGTYFITYTTPGPYCANSFNFELTILQEDTAQISYPKTVYCLSDSNPSPMIIGAQGGTFTGTNGLVIDSNTGVIDILSSTIGNHMVIYTTSNVNCPYQSTFDINTTTKDDPTFIFNDSVFCSSDPNQTPTVLGVPGGYFYSTDGLIIVDSLTGEININQTGIGLYSISYVTPNTDCKDTLTISIEIKSPQIAYAGEDQYLFYQFDTELNANEPLYGTGLWLSENNLYFSNENNPFTTVSNLQIGNNILIWTINDSICPVSMDSVLINIKNLQIPQIITPNNDGTNDYLIIKGIENVLDNHIEIYNRWGQLVYETNNYQNNWYGTDLNGNILINDTYFYVLTIDKDIYKGFIVIKK